MEEVASTSLHVNGEISKNSAETLYGAAVSETPPPPPKNALISTAKISLRHQTALKYSAAGIPVFCCRVNGKEPGIRGGRGFKDATTDVDQINAWFAIA